MWSFIFALQPPDWSELAQETKQEDKTKAPGQFIAKALKESN